MKARSTEEVVSEDEIELSGLHSPSGKSSEMRIMMEPTILKSTLVFSLVIIVSDLP